MSVWTAMPIASPPDSPWPISSASTSERVVVATLAAVLHRLVESQEAELAHPLHYRVRERRLLPLNRVRTDLVDRPAPDRLPELLVLVGEDEVLALARVVRLDDIGSAHAEP